MEFNFFKSA